MSLQNKFEILKILLDKGLLALLILFAGLLLNRALERFKAREAWVTELTRMRMELARRLLQEVFDLEKPYAEFRASAQLVGDERMAKVEAKIAAFGTFHRSVLEAKVFLPKLVAEDLQAVLETVKSFAVNDDVLFNSFDEVLFAKEMNALENSTKRAVDSLRDFLEKSVIARRS